MKPTFPKGPPNSSRNERERERERMSEGGHRAHPFHQVLLLPQRRLIQVAALPVRTTSFCAPLLAFAMLKVVVVVAKKNERLEKKRGPPLFYAGKEKRRISNQCTRATQRRRRGEPKERMRSGVFNLMVQK